MQRSTIRSDFHRARRLQKCIIVALFSFYLVQLSFMLLIRFFCVSIVILCWVACFVSVWFLCLFIRWNFFSFDVCTTDLVKMGHWHLKLWKHPIPLCNITTSSFNVNMPQQQLQHKTIFNTQKSVFKQKKPFNVGDTVDMLWLFFLLGLKLRQVIVLWKSN